MYILKSRRSIKQSRPNYEQGLLGTTASPGRIATGTLTDKDIRFIVDSRDRQLVNALESKYRKEKKNSDHIKRMYGSAFDNKDNEGNLYKDSDISLPITAPTSSEQDVQSMQSILKENL